MNGILTNTIQTTITIKKIVITKIIAITGKEIAITTTIIQIILIAIIINIIINQIVTENTHLFKIDAIVVFADYLDVLDFKKVAHKGYNLHIFT